MRNFGYLLQYIPIWAVLKLTRGIPLDRRGDIIGRLLVRLAPIAKPQMKRALTNIALAFPDKTLDEHKAIAKGSAFNVGKTLTEILNMDQLKANPPEIRATGPGLEAFKENLAQKKGAVIASAHFGQWEAMRFVIRELGAEVGAVYRPNNNPYYEQLFFDAMSATGGPLYAKGTDQVKDMVKYAAKGGVIGILSDQRFSKGARIPFMGHDALTSPAPAQIAKRLGIPLFTIYNVRRDWGVEVQFDAPIPQGDSIEMMAQVHKSLEDRIHENPDQWYWFHNRWAGATD